MCLGLHSLKIHHFLQVCVEVGIKLFVQIRRYRRKAFKKYHFILVIDSSGPCLQSLSSLLECCVYKRQSTIYIFLNFSKYFFSSWKTKYDACLNHLANQYQQIMPCHPSRSQSAIFSGTELQKVVPSSHQIIFLPTLRPACLSWLT